MTAISKVRAPVVTDRGKRVVVMAMFAGIGILVGLGLGWVLESNSVTASAYQGPTVERSLAMQANINALIEGARAQAAALGANGNTYRGPLVERSMAMERNQSALVEGGEVQASHLQAGSSTYQGSMVERSLAMDRNHEALIEWGQAQAAALRSGQ